MEMTSEIEYEFARDEKKRESDELAGVKSEKNRAAHSLAGKLFTALIQSFPSALQRNLPDGK